MKPLICLALALAVAMPALAETHPITVRAYEQAGDLKIDKNVHETATLQEGDRIQWKCDCPAGAKLDVQDLKHVAILSLLTSAEKKRVKGELEKHGGGQVVPNYPEGEAPYRPGSPFMTKIKKPKDTEVLSGEYRGFKHDHIWKFKWVVTKGSKTAEWDPHFSGARR